MVGLGVKIENIFVCDSKGVIYEGRPGGYDESKARFAQKTELRTLADAVNGADVFLGCSAPGVLTQDMVKIELADSNNSALFTIPDDKGFKYVVMPMRI